MWLPGPWTLMPWYLGLIISEQVACNRGQATPFLTHKVPVPLAFCSGIYKVLGSFSCVPEHCWGWWQVSLLVSLSPHLRTLPGWMQLTDLGTFPAIPFSMLAESVVSETALPTERRTAPFACCAFVVDKLMEVEADRLWRGWWTTRKRSTWQGTGRNRVGLVGMKEGPGRPRLSVQHLVLCGGCKQALLPGPTQVSDWTTPVELSSAGQQGRAFGKNQKEPHDVELILSQQAFLCPWGAVCSVKKNWESVLK